MIRYLKHNEIDFIKWDFCISNAVNAYVYAYSWYLNLIAERWDALIEDDYISVFPLPCKSKFGIQYIFQPPFVQQLGLFSQTKISPELLNQFVREIPEKFSWIDININKFIIPGHLIQNIRNRTNIELNLQRDYTEIYKAYSDNVKRNIKKAQKSGLQYFDGVNPQELIQLFFVNKGNNASFFTGKDYSKLNHLLHTLIHKNILIIRGIYSTENNLIAAAAFLNSNQRLIFLFSGLSDEGKNVGAMHFLINSVIKENSSQSLTLDFEGSDDENLCRFYQSFGASKFEYYTLQMNRLNLILKPIFAIYQKLKI